MIRPAAGSEPTHIVVLATLGAPERRWLRGRRAQATEPDPDPEPVTTTRATVIEAAAMDEAQAGQWLSSDEPATAVEDGLAVLNRTLHAHRLAAADPYVREVAAESALVTRVGHGTGDQVSEGRWSEALTLPAPRRARERRVAALRPQERLAALLSGRDRSLACEELALRARHDLDEGRGREAALQLRVALEAGIAELERSETRVADMDQRVGELREERGAVGEAANQALRGPLTPATTEAVEHALHRLEAALRARSAAGFD